MKKLKYGDAAYLEWTDSCSDTRTWVDIDSFSFNDHDKALFYKTVGFFVKKTKVATYICESMRVDTSSGGTNLGHIFAIPNIAISKIRKIKL